MAAPSSVCGSSQDPVRGDQSKVISLDPGLPPDDVIRLKKAMVADLGSHASKEAAIQLRVDPGLFSRYLSLFGMATPPVRLVADWTRRYGPNLLLEINAAAGFTCQRAAGTPGEPDHEGMAPAVARMATGAATTLSACVEALVDGVIDEQERALLHAVTGRLLLDVRALHEATRPAGESSDEA